jgi:hypothetical protein
MNVVGYWALKKMSAGEKIITSAVQTTNPGNGSVVD